MKEVSKEAFVRHVPIDEPIDLLNVAFENPHKLMVQAQGNTGGLPKKQKKERQRRQINLEHTLDTSYMVPDRITGLQELEELGRLCPGRVWNFVRPFFSLHDSNAHTHYIGRLRSTCRIRFVQALGSVCTRLKLFLLLIGISSFTSGDRVTHVSWTDRHGHGITQSIPSE
jgi:hypothetical protein